MKTTAIERQAFLPMQMQATRRPHFLDRLAARSLRKRLACLKHGALTFADADSAAHFGARTERCALAATVRVHDPRFYGDIACGGSIGSGEAYMQGYWSADDLTALMRILLQNRAVLEFQFHRQ